LTIIRRFAVIGVLLAMFVSLTSGSAQATVRNTPSKNTAGEVKTGVEFLSIAYTWKTAWYAGGHCGPSIGKRDKVYTAQALDTILTKVCIAPETDANTTSFTPLSGQELSAKALPGKVIALKIKLTIKYGNVGNKATVGTLTTSVRVSHGKNGWKAVGVALPGASGPTKYCVDSPAAAMHCNIYPPGSN
jgi:hypothetical protein